MSSSSRLQARVQEPEKDEQSFTRPMENRYSEEFARFKAAVDKDPFVAVFGRRLESPPSSNNSSWTSLLRVFESVPPEDVNSRKASPSDGPASATDENGVVPEQSSTHVTSERAGERLTQASCTTKPIVSNEEVEYEFDPISMKKVPKKPEMQPPAETEKPPFLSTLFAEHGVEIPVKPYKPHKVYGYPGKDESRAQSSKSGNSTSPRALKKKFESSRLQELQKLKATTLGNGVDATNFCEKYEVKENDAKVATSDSKPTPASEKPVHEAPLFSGTTYEAKSQTILGAQTASKKDWLAEEGFRTSPSIREPPPSNALAPTSSENRAPLGPVSKIQPSLDRISSPGVKSALNQSKRKQSSIFESGKHDVEDLDMLRPSDVRAQVGCSRKPGHETDLNKEAPQHLEANNMSRQHRNDENGADAEDPLAVSAKKLQDGLSSLWRRVRNQPQYTNLANTIKNMGALQDAWKKYSRNRIIENPNEKLVFKDQNLSKTPSIYKKTTQKSDRGIEAFTPSKEVLDAERESQNRTAALRAANENAKREEAERKRQDAELASEIRKAYESQYGSIDIHHRQVAQADEIAAPKSADSQHKAVAETERHQLPKSQISSFDIPRSPQKAVAEDEKATDTGSTQQDVKTIQPQIDRLVEEVRNTRKVLHEISLHVKAIKSRRPPTYWNTSITESSSDVASSAIAPSLRAAPEPPKVPLSETKSSHGSAMKDIAAYTASVVAANQSAAKAQNVQEMRARHPSEAQRKEEWVQPLVPRIQDCSDSAVPEREDLKAERVNQVQAREKAVVEASAEALAQQKAGEIKDSSGKDRNTMGVKMATAAPDTASPSLDAASQEPGVYKILAYDSSSLQISMATATSSFAAPASGSGELESPLHPTEVLSRLNNPAKFLPYFQGLQDEGYEIVSGSGDILVFKKVREFPKSTTTDGSSQTVTTTAEQPDTPMQKEAATVLEEIPSKPAPPPPAPPSSPKVRRQEDVFSGSGQTWRQEEAQSQSNSDSEQPSEGSWYRIKRGARRVFFTGLAAAGVAYAIGAVAESFGAEQQPLYDPEQVNRAGVRTGIYSTESSR